MIVNFCVIVIVNYRVIVNYSVIVNYCVIVIVNYGVIPSCAFSIARPTFCEVPEYLE